MDALGNGNQIRTTNAEGNTITSQYNASGQLIGEKDARGNKTTYAYDLLGNLVQQTDAKGGVIQTTTQYQYDTVGNLEKLTYANGRSVTYHYTKTNQIQSMEDWLGVTRYEYDAMGQTKCCPAN